MSFLAKLQIEHSEMNVLECSFSFTQDVNTIGQPASIPKGGTIELTVESAGSTHLFDWMISPTQVKSGSITFYRRDAMSKLKELIFTDAHCVDYHEHYKHDGDYPMQITLTVSAKTLNLNGSQFENNWSK